MDVSTFGSLLMDLTPEKKEALINLILAARSIDADLSFNADTRGLYTRLHTTIESVRVRALLDALKILDGQ